MSFRVEGETLDEQVNSIEAHIRFLYKCCGRPPAGTFDVVAATFESTWPGDGGFAGPWYPAVGGPVSLFSVTASRRDIDEGIDCTSSVVDLTRNGVTIVTVEFAPGQEVVEVPVDPAEVFIDTDFLSFVQRGDGCGGWLVVQAQFDGDTRGSGGLNFDADFPA